MLCVLQCRMSSQRLPGKMLKDVHGRCLLGRVVDRLANSNKITKLIVATSNDESDDAIENFCYYENLNCFRGSLKDVARRFLDVALLEKAPSFIRINGDSPFIDVSIIDYAVSLFEQGEVDLVTNVLKRSFPKGQSVEVILTNTFKTAYHLMTSDLDREHVTKYFYDRVEEFKIVSFSCGMNLGNVNMCIDTIEDHIRAETIIKKFPMELDNWQLISNLISQLGGESE